MALSLETIRDRIRTSIHGRRLGLDGNDQIAGVKGMTRPVTDATSDTTGTALPNYGIVSVVTTTDDTWTLSAPYIGSEVTLMTGSSSTGVHTITMEAGTVIYSTNGIAGANVLLAGAGAAVSLVGVTTARWNVTSMAASSVSNSVSS